MVHSTIWCVSAFCSSRIVTSSATSRCSAETSFSSSFRVAAWTAIGSSGSGSNHGSTSAGRALPDSVSEVSAAVSLDTRTRSPAIAWVFGRRLVGQRRRQRAGALVVDVVVGVGADVMAGEP